MNYSPSVVRMNPVARQRFLPIFHPSIIEAVKSTGIPYSAIPVSATIMFIRRKLNGVRI